MKVGEDLLIKRWPISDATVQGSCMNEVKAFFAKDPWFSEIVYFEVQIGRYQRRLCGTKICSKYLFLLLWYCGHKGTCYTDLGRWIFIRKIDRPYTRASA